MNAFFRSIGLIIVILLTSPTVLAEELKEKPIARVFEQTITLKNILPPENILEQNRAKLSQDKFEQWHEDYKMKTLEGIIYSELQKAFMKKTKMMPTDDEIQAHIDFSIKNDQERAGELVLQRENILTQLKAADLTESNEKELNSYLKTIEQLIKYDKERKEEGKSIPNYSEIKANSRRSIATAMVASWKFNKALYETYGGRVIFQQFGWEPIDAYKAFLNEHTKAKSFEIFDTTYEKAFNRMYQYFEMGHNYMEKELADKYFAKPWWDPAFEPL